MAVTQIAYTGDGSTVLFSFTFEYIDESEIIVEVDRTVTTEYTLANPTTIQFNTPPANGALILITRRTDIDAPRAVFYPGSSIRSNDLNTNFDQSRFSVQEWRDQKAPLYNAVFPDRIDMDGNPIINVEDPTNAQDAATKNYVDTTTWNVTTETLDSGETWVPSDNTIATTQAIENRVTTKIDDAITNDIAGADGITVTDDGDGTITLGLADDSIDFDKIKGVDIINQAEQDAGSPAPADNNIFTGLAASKRFDTIVSNDTPVGSDWEVGKTWLQPVPDNTLSIWNGSGWIGVASGGTFLSQPTVIYVDAANGDDAFDGHRIINPKKTIKNAVASANAGDIILVTPGVYQESLPIDITVSNLSIVGQSIRSCFIHPTTATETETMFRCNSGTYITGFTFAGLKASGARGGHPVDNDPTYGLPTNQGWVASFYPGAIIKKSPYIQNCTNFADSGIDNDNFDPNNFAGTGGDLTSAPTGGGIFVDGSVPSTSSPLRSFVVDSFTQICLDGPGCLVANNGYAQLVSFFGTFCHYHTKALSGGQVNLTNSTTDFGRYGLIADGKSTSPIFTATANGAASAGDITFAINQPTDLWFGSATRPLDNMVVVIGSDLYPILSSSPNGLGWNVTISNPNPSNRAENLGLVNGHSNGAAISFYLRSLCSTSGHTFEYAGSGTDYTALPENGGVADESKQTVNLNEGRVWQSSTDQNGKFKVGDTFVVDQKTGFVTIDPQSYSTNLVSDLSPQLGGDLDVLNRRIFSTTGNVYINDPVEVNLGSATSPSVTFNGDTNTGIYSPGADQLALSTDGTGKLFVDASGRVGINNSSMSSFTANGADNLVVGSGASSEGITIYSGTSGQGSITFADGTTGDEAYRGYIAYSHTADAFQFITAAEERLRITSTGTVNIVGAGTAGSTQAVSFNGSAPVNSLVIDSSGRLLVGTSSTSSISRSVIQGAAGADHGIIYLARNNAPPFATSLLGSFNFSDNGHMVAAAIDCRRDSGTWTPGVSQPTTLLFSTTANGASSLTERMRIQSNGNVTIGNPNGGSDSFLGWRRSIDGAAAFNISTDGLHGVIQNESGQGKILISTNNDFAGNNTNPIELATGGVPGTVRLRVNNIGVYFPTIGTTASAANAFLDNANSNSLLRSTSSLRYKTDIENLEESRANAILGFRPVWYRSTASADRSDWSWYGLIAEEVAAIEPRLVHWTYLDDAYEEVDGEKQLKPDAELVPDGVQYDRLTVLLLDVVKRQQQTIADLEARVAALEAS